MEDSSAFKKTYEIFTALVNRACLPTDSAVEKTNKGILLITSIIIAFLAIFWGLGYMALGYPISGAIPLSYAAISFSSMIYFYITRHFVFFRFSQLLLILLLPFLLQWSLGGFANGSVVMIWAFFTPLAAMLFTDSHQATRWLYAFLILTVLSILIDNTVEGIVPTMGYLANTIFFAVNMGFGFTGIFIVLNYFVKERESSHNQEIIAKENALETNKALEISNQQLQDNETKIRELMHTDWLTGVSNRRHLDERLNSELERVQRYDRCLSIVMADLDHFKQVNDTYGHGVGDTVLSVFASIISNTIREADFVSRYGGEEFLIILPEACEEGAVRLIERIRKQFSERTISPISAPITASFGITMANSKDSINVLLQRVDHALYQAKESGRNCYVVFNEDEG